VLQRITQAGQNESGYHCLLQINAAEQATHLYPRFHFHLNTRKYTSLGKKKLFIKIWHIKGYYLRSFIPIAS
jgi:hypothetical protein